MDISTEEFLEHHGVKGMRWGVRRASDASNRFVKEHPKTIKVIGKASEVASLTMIAGIGASQLALHYSQHPEKYLKAAKLVGDHMRDPMSAATKAARGARMVFDDTGHMKYYPPGRFHPGDFQGVAAQVGSGFRMLTAG